MPALVLTLLVLTLLVLATILLLVITPLIGLASHFGLRLGQHAGIMFGVLQKVLGSDAVARKLGIARQYLVFVDDLLRGAPHLAFGARAVKHPVDDVPERTGPVLFRALALVRWSHKGQVPALIEAFDPVQRQSLAATGQRGVGGSNGGTKEVLQPVCRPDCTHAGAWQGGHGANIPIFSSLGRFIAAFSSRLRATSRAPPCPCRPDRAGWQPTESPHP